MLRVTPLSGSRYSAVGEADEPSCTIVEFSDCRCLVNVGQWQSNINTKSSLEDNELDAAATASSFPTHNCVLLTDSTLQSVGGLPTYFEHVRQLWMNGAIETMPPIYATYPTVKMGQMTLYDHHATICMEGGSPPYSLQAVDDVCAYITAIKYNQQITVSSASASSALTESNNMTPSSSSLIVTAHRAGHVVGGAFFVLHRPQDETSVVITEATYHIAKELHLDSGTLLQYASTPDVLITKPGGPAFGQFKALPNSALPSQLVSQAERTLTETIVAVLRRDGNVLLPVDCSGRVLELLLLLHQEWDKQRLRGIYHLIWLAPMCANVIEFARSQLEWMAAALGTQFDNGHGHPFALPAVRFCTSLVELNDILSEEPNNPACVLASGLSLEGGPARDVLLKWADNPDNAIIFTDSSQCYLRQRQQHLDRTKKGSGAATTTRRVSHHGEVHDMEIEPGSQTSTGGEAIKADIEAVSATLTQESTEIAAASSASAAVIVAPEDADDDDVGTTLEGGTATLIGEALTEATRSPWTTAGQLMQAWAQAKAAGAEMEDSIVIDVNVPVRSPLAGAELRTFMANEEAVRQAALRAEEKRAMLAQVELAKGQLHLGEDDAAAASGAGEATTKSNNLTTANKPTGTTSIRPRKKSRFDSTLFLKYSKPLHLTFELREEAVGIGQPDATSKYEGIGEGQQQGDVVEDDYGISVQHERFTDIVSGVDPSKFAGGSGRIGEDVLRRGLGFDGADGMRNKLKTNAGGAKLISDDENDRGNGIGRLDEKALEALDLSEGNGIIRGRNGRPPTKVSTVPRKLEVLAEVSFVPGLEGRVDARAARQSVRALQPREVIVLGGAKRSEDVGSNGTGGNEPQLATDEVGLLAEAARSFATGSKQILTPSNGETAELAVGHAAYSVRLIDAPYLTKEEKEEMLVSGEVEPIEPTEMKLGVCTVSMVDCVATGQKVALDNSLVLAPRHNREKAVMMEPSIYLSDGEILLTDLRAEIIGLGLKAEYSAHAGYSQLVVNGKIVVRKEHNDDSGRLQVEGPLCEDFYTVRSIVCGQYVALSTDS